MVEAPLCEWVDDMNYQWGISAIPKAIIHVAPSLRHGTCFWLVKAQKVEKKIPNEDLWQLIIIPRNVCNQTKRKRKIASKMKPAAARWMVGSSSRSLSHQIDRKRKRWRRRWRRESLSCVRHNRRLWRYLVREQCWSSELCSWMDAWIDQAVRFKKFKQH